MFFGGIRPATQIEIPLLGYQISPNAMCRMSWMYSRLSKAVNEKPERKLVVHNHRLHAKGYVSDTVCGH